MQLFRFRPWLIPTLLAMFTVLLRLPSINFGLPFEHHVDDELTFGIVDEMLASGSPVPPFFGFGHLYIYLSYGGALLVRLLGHSPYPREYDILVSRAIYVMLSAGGVVLLYQLARRIYGQTERAVVAALCFAASTTYIVLSLDVKADLLLLLGTLVASWLAWRYHQTNNRRWASWLFVVAGLTVGTKISYALFMMFPVVVFAHQQRWRITRTTIFELARLTAVAANAFLIHNVFKFAQLKTWLGITYYQYIEYSSGEYFYFKSVYSDFWSHLITLLRIVFGYFWLISPWSGLVAVIIGSVFIYKCWSLWQMKQSWLLVWLLFPALYLVFAASRQVLQIRTMLPMMPFIFLVVFYPVTVTKPVRLPWISRVLERAKHLKRLGRYLNQLGRYLNQRAGYLSWLVVILLTLYSWWFVIDVRTHHAEQQVMNFITTHQGKFALPNVFRFPSIEYAYHSPRQQVDLTKHSFFQENQAKLAYYTSATDLAALLDQVDYLVVQQQMLQSLNYRESNLNRTEPTFEPVDIAHQQVKLDELLDQRGFKLVLYAASSPHETTAEFDPANLGLKQLMVYQKQQKR